MYNYDNFSTPIKRISFIPYKQLEDSKKKRIRDSGILPLEDLTYEILRSYKRDHLRVYGYVYGMQRRKKPDMEQEIAEFLPKLHPNDPNFDPAIYKSYVEEANMQLAEKEREKDTDSKAPHQKFNLGESSNLASQDPYTKTNQFSSIKPQKRISMTPHRPPSRSPSNFKSFSYNHPSSFTPGMRLTPSNNRSMASPSEQKPQNTVSNDAIRVDLPLKRKALLEKQGLHARQAGVKFKAAFDGSGPLAVKIIENAAAYFAESEPTKVADDKNIALHRYQRNCALLNRIFWEPKIEGPEESYEERNKNILDMSSKALSSTEKQIIILKKKIESLKNERSTEKVDLIFKKTYGKLEKAPTPTDVQAAKLEMERQLNGIFANPSREFVERKVSLKEAANPSQNLKLFSL